MLSRDPANWWRTIQIDLGSRDGVRENLPVLTPEGLVGRVTEVSLLRSKVVLIGDANCKVPALVENEARDKGVILSSGPLDGSFVSLTYLASNANLKPGQKVVTSDLSAIYPKGISIGVIADVRPVESGLYLEAEVKLSARLSSSRKCGYYSDDSAVQCIDFARGAPGGVRAERLPRPARPAWGATGPAAGLDGLYRADFGTVHDDRPGGRRRAELRHAVRESPGHERPPLADGGVY